MKKQRIQYGPDDSYFVLPEEKITGVKKVHNYFLVQCTGGHVYFAMISEVDGQIIPVLTKAEDFTEKYLIED